jgi:hypothetical protein
MIVVGTHRSVAGEVPAWGRSRVWTPPRRDRHPDARPSVARSTAGCGRIELCPGQQAPTTALAGVASALAAGRAGSPTGLARSPTHRHLLGNVPVISCAGPSPLGMTHTAALPGTTKAGTTDTETTGTETTHVRTTDTETASTRRTDTGTTDTETTSTPTTDTRTTDTEKTDTGTTGTATTGGTNNNAGTNHAGTSSRTNTGMTGTGTTSDSAAGTGTTSMGRGTTSRDGTRTTGRATATNPATTAGPRIQTGVGRHHATGSRPIATSGTTTRPTRRNGRQAATTPAERTRRPAARDHASSRWPGSRRGVAGS